MTDPNLCAVRRHRAPAVAYAPANSGQNQGDAQRNGRPFEASPTHSMTWPRNASADSGFFLALFGLMLVSLFRAQHLGFEHAGSKRRPVPLEGTAPRPGAEQGGARASIPSIVVIARIDVATMEVPGEATLLKQRGASHVLARHGRGQRCS